ncbi:MAG: hypothetical protein WB580_02795 [Candidatus Binataceae bacterium]
MDKSKAIRLLPGTAVLFRGRRHSVMSVKSGLQSDAPFFRLRDLDDGALTGLISHRVLEAAPEAHPLEQPAQD